MARRANQIEEGAPRIVGRVTVVVAQALGFATPVDTGRARGGWLASLNVAREGEGPPDPSGTSVTTQALAIAARIREERDEAVIVNNVPYIESLNNGSSRQAPAGFVQTAIQLGSIEAGKARILER